VRMTLMHCYAQSRGFTLSLNRVASPYRSIAWEFILRGLHSVALCGIIVMAVVIIGYVHNGLCL
jgi:hypothetical protein